MNAAFDLGGTFLRCAVDAGSGELQSIRRVRIAGLPWGTIVEAMRAYIIRVQERYGELERIAVSFPGPIANGLPLCAPTLATGSTPHELPRMFTGITNAPVDVLNDVSAAAWCIAERTNDDRFIAITISSGIGAKVYDRSRPQPIFDDAPFAGELGHITVDFSPHAPQCDCGGKGHLGAIASGRGIERHVRGVASRDRAGFSSSLCARNGREPHRLTNEDDIGPAARAGDAWTLQAICEATKPLAAVLAAAVQSCGLQRVVVIGGFARAVGNPYAMLLEEEITLRLAPAAFGARDARIVEIADADDEVCLRGAALFARARGRLACTSLS